jgi:hypothetical protein
VTKKSEKINLDEGIASHDYKPTKLLERKAYLIKKLEAADYRQGLERVDYKSYQYMLERLQG